MNGGRQVVVTGMEAISAAGVGLSALWDAVVEGRSHGAPIRRFDVAGNGCHIAAEVPDFDPEALGLDPAQRARMDRATQFALVAARRALRRSGNPCVDPRRAGVLLGTAIGGVAFMERQFNAVARRNGHAKPAWVEVAPEEVDGHLYDAFLAHSVSTEIQRDQGFCGPCLTMTTGCTAGLDAIGAAAEMVASGRADVMVTGGTDAPITPIVVSSFDNIGCLTRRNGEPARSSRPFDRDRDGFLLAEGCAVLVLEAEETARARGAWIHGYVLGFASLSNAFHMTGLPPDGASLARTLRRAMERGRVDADALSYVNAHGSSTPQNDRNETAAFKSAFGSAARRLPISSTKSVLGHSLGAASALETVVCLAALETGVVPPTANYETPCPHCDLDYVPNAARDADLRIVECNASGFSGIHSSLLLARREVGEAR